MSDLPPDLLSLIVRRLAGEAYYVALVCRAFLVAEQGARSGLSPRISPLWTAFVSIQRLVFCLRDRSFAAIFKKASLRLAVRSAAFQAADTGVIDYVTSRETLPWDHVANSHKAVARIAEGGSESFFQQMVIEDRAPFRNYFDAKLQALAAECSSTPSLDPGVEYLLTPVVQGGQSSAFKAIRTRVRELWDERNRLSSLWGMIFGSPACLCRTTLATIAAKLEDGAQMLSLIVEEILAFSTLPCHMVRVQVAAHVIGLVHQGASGCALEWCTSQAPSMGSLARHIECQMAAGVDIVLSNLSNPVGLIHMFSGQCHFLRPRKESAFVFVMRQMREGGWMRDFVTLAGVPINGQSPAQHYANLHASAAFEEAETAELLWPREPLRLLQRCAMDLVDEALVGESFGQMRDALLLLKKLAISSTRAGLECMAMLHVKHNRGERRRKLIALYSSPIMNNAAQLLVQSIRLGLLGQAESILSLYGSRAVPDSADARYTLVSYALLSGSSRLMFALRRSGLQFERMSRASLVSAVRKLGATHMIEMGVCPNSVQKAARQRGRIVPHLQDSTIAGDAPRP